MSLGGESMDKIIDFNELKNRVNDKDVDQFESYIYSLVHIDMWNGFLKQNNY